METEGVGWGGGGLSSCPCLSEEAERVFSLLMHHNDKNSPHVSWYESIC